MWIYLEALLPSAGLLFILYIVLKRMVEADRRERSANSEWDSRHAGDPGPEQPETGSPTDQQS